MYIPAADTLESARVVHSFLEWSALGFFAGVVACDVVLHLMEDRKGLRIAGWSAREWHFIFRQHCFAIKWWPACKSGIGIKGFLKTQSLVWFGLAIGLEILALPYSERIDELADEELLYSQKRTVVALTKASQAIERASKADERSKILEHEDLILRAEVLRLNERTTLRGVTLERNRQLFVNALTRFAGQEFVIQGSLPIKGLISGMGDDVSSLVEKLRFGVLAPAGWRYREMLRQYSQPEQGGARIEIAPRCPGKVRVAANTLAGLLARYVTPASVLENDMLDLSAIRIIIEPRPESLQR